VGIYIQKPEIEEEIFPDVQLSLILSQEVTINRFCSAENMNYRQVGGFIRAIRFPPPIKLTATMKLKHC
jgi:hypothetical protein